MSVTTTTVVLDTCVLVADPDSLTAFGDADIVLPLTVIAELDGHKSRSDSVGWAARETLRAIEKLRCANDGNISSAVALPTGGTVRIELNGLHLEPIVERGLDPNQPDNRILAAALGLKNDGAVVKVVSLDAALRIKASQFGLVAEDYLRSRPEAHTAQNPGWHTVEVPGGFVDDMYASDAVAMGTLLPDEIAAFDGMALNEFAICKAGQQSVLARLVDDDKLGPTLRRLPKRTSAWGLEPRTTEQRFALDLLLDPDVPIVGLSGHAGTGKTILALAAALEQVFEPSSQRYDRVMILRPMVSVGRQDVGFLPGTLEEKLGPWMQAITDAMVALGDDLTYQAAEDLLSMWVDAGKLTMEPVTYLRGRSLMRSLVLVDEAQNLEMSVAKTVLSRLGEGSKCVLVGDTSQIDAPYLSEHSNALSVLADALIGEKLFGHLVLTEGQRSAVANLAATKL